MLGPAAAIQTVPTAKHAWPTRLSNFPVLSETAGLVCHQHSTQQSISRSSTLSLDQCLGVLLTGAILTHTHKSDSHVARSQVYLVVKVDCTCPQCGCATSASGREGWALRSAEKQVLVDSRPPEGEYMVEHTARHASLQH